MGALAPPPRQEAPPSPKASKSQVFYAIVMHDFEAERADELDAKRGDAITVVAQSNREWFVAKPIGRLGRPGLIPVSFVEIHDPSTGKAIPDVEALMDRGDLPKVEDWKRAMFNYKQNSIALGVIDAPTNRESQSVPNSPFTPQYSPLPPPPRDPSISVQAPSPNTQSYPPNDQPPPEPYDDSLPDGILLSADVVSFHFEMEEYWFRIDATFQPFTPPGQQTLPPARHLVLFRVYNDFYDFQVSLLNAFPREAGREPPIERILPFMPGPAEDVDDALTATRRVELDDYLHSLCALSRGGATYILEHGVVREFLTLKPGDVMNDTAPRVQEMEALFAADFPGPDDGYFPQMPTAGKNVNDVQNSLSRLKVQDDNEKSDGSEYEDEGYAPSPQRPSHDRDRHPYAVAGDRRPSDDNNLRLHAHAQNHQRNGSSSSLPRNNHPYTSNSRSNSPAGDPYQSHWNSNSHKPSSPSTSSHHSSQSPSVSGRSRSHSTATSNFNTPPISAANPQTAFVKIKIFDRVADDLIAIRVHPRVTHAELMDKVQTRLGGEVAYLKFRDSINGAFVGLDNDQDLRTWMESTDKHVLYAD